MIGRWRLILDGRKTSSRLCFCLLRINSAAEYTDDQRQQWSTHIPAHALLVADCVTAASRHRRSTIRATERRNVARRCMGWSRGSDSLPRSEPSTTLTQPLKIWTSLALKPLDRCWSALFRCWWNCLPRPYALHVMTDIKRNGRRLSLLLWGWNMSYWLLLRPAWYSTETMSGQKLSPTESPRVRLNFRFRVTVRAMVRWCWWCLRGSSPGEVCPCF